MGRTKILAIKSQL